MQRLRRQLLSHVGLVRWFIGISVFLAIIAASLWLRQPVHDVSAGLRHVYQDNLPDHNGRVNFLVMGIGGKNHEGSDLTDTLMFISIDKNTGDTFLLSIPRDIWVSSLKSKINTAYHYGELRQPGGGGLILAKASVSEIIAQPVDFAAVIDFSTFADFIDQIGGVDVTVEKTFDDFDYPISGRENDLCNDDPEYRCRYEQIHFDSGVQHMDGDTALKFVRSRHSPDPAEGSDFARSRRQELVISAIQHKLVSQDIFTKPKIYQKLIDLLSRSIQTDITSEHYYQLLKLSLKVKNQVFRSSVLVEPDLLIHPVPSIEYNNQWVLLPSDKVAGFVTSQLQSVQSQ